MRVKSWVILSASIVLMMGLVACGGAISAETTPIPPTATIAPTPTAMAPAVVEPIALPATPDCADPVGTTSDAQAEHDSLILPMPYRIYLPPCYDPDTATPYPLMVLIHGRGGGHFTWHEGSKLADLLDAAILAGEIPPLVVVTPLLDSDDRLGESILAALMPAIEAEVAVSSEPGGRLIAGGSWGATVSARLAMQHPEQFNTAGIFGAGIINRQEADFQTWLDAISAETPIPPMFVNTGGEDNMLESDTARLLTFLETNNLPHHFVTDPEGSHTYAYWLTHLVDYIAWSFDAPTEN